MSASLWQSRHTGLGRPSLHFLRQVGPVATLSEGSDVILYLASGVWHGRQQDLHSAYSLSQGVESVCLPATA